MTHQERVTRALTFQSPDRVPLEIHDVPYLYDAYGTLDPGMVTLVPGTEEFDSLRVTYHWTFTDLGRNVNGETLRRDEWGCLHRVPADECTAYEILEKPLTDPTAFAHYEFPDPALTDPFFARTAHLIAEHYPDRFVCGYVDPGPLLVAFNLMGYEGLLTRLYDDLDQVLAVIRGIVNYQKGVIDRWAGIGVPMVAIIDEFAGTDGLMFSPDLWRRYCAPCYEELFAHIRSHGMLAGCLFDGDISAILPDYLSIKPDVVEIMQPNLVGIERWRDALRGRVAAKASVDMMSTLATGTPEACRREALRLIEAFHTPSGGFMGISLRWHRPEYPAANVAAVAEVFGHLIQRV